MTNIQSEGGRRGRGGGTWGGEKREEGWLVGGSVHLRPICFGNFARDLGKVKGEGRGGEGGKREGGEKGGEGDRRRERGGGRGDSSRGRR